jgi:hypothetical protein
MMAAALPLVGAARDSTLINRPENRLKPALDRTVA